MNDEQGTKRKPGRPLGAKNRSRETIPEFRPVCPACQSTDSFKKQPTKHPLIMVTTAPNGQPCDRQEWFVRQCKACDYQWEAHTYHYGGKGGEIVQIFQESEEDVDPCDKLSG